VRCVLILVIVAALAVAPPALAHTTVSPERIPPDSESRLTFAVPNEGSAPFREVRIDLSAFELEAVESIPGWRVTRTAHGAVWTGGSIPVGVFATFSVTGTPTHAGRIGWTVVTATASQRTHVNGSIAVAAPPRTRSSGLATAAFAIAIVAAAAAVGAFFLALALWLRGPRDELQES
jgi:hypothetical protein